jgi:CRP-like cAMP-binding protein
VTHAPLHDVSAARDVVALLDADDEFADGLEAGELARARRLVVVPRLELGAGPWSLTDAAPWAGPGTAVLVLRGLLLRESTLADRTAAELIGPGDVVHPWAQPSDLLPRRIEWAVKERAVVAVLDGRFQAAARHWPALGAVVLRRLTDRTERLAAQAAYLQLPCVGQRVIALMWQLSERFGRVSPDGVVIPLRLTHELIGRLVGARRPTVSLALADLAATGVLTRRGEARWLLDPASLDSLAPAAAATPAAAVPTVPVAAAQDAAA